jgi:undecaprenyl-diphosphatase
MVAIILGTAVSYQILDPMFVDQIHIEGGTAKTLFGWITHIGKSDWILVSTGSILVFMSVYRFPNLSVSHFVHWHHIFLKIYFAFTAVALSGLIAVIVKNLIGRARPVFYEGSDFWFSSPFTDTYMFASFPSGHSTTMGALIVVLFLITPRLFILLAPIGFLVAISRIVIGVHFVSDVFAGLALGMVFTWVYARVFARKRLLFEFDNAGYLRLRDGSAKRARRRIRKNSQSITDLGFGLSRRTASKKT